MSDTTIANVALPSIQQGAHASSGALEWVVSGYALTFGLALVPAARLGDRYGYKRLFLTGLSLFTLASVACGVSQNAGELIIARLVQGLGAGIYYPAVSAIIQRLFTGKDRSRAFGYLGGVVGVSTAAGPLLGGLLVQLAGVTDGWRWVFLVNLFIGIAALPVAFRLLPSRHDPEEHRLDPAGNLLLAAVLLLILIPLVEGRVSGWPAWSWLLLGLAVPAAAALVAWELRLDRRGGEPVIQVGLLRERRRRWSTCASSPSPSRAPSACPPGWPARTRNRRPRPHRARATGRHRAPRSQAQACRPGRQAQTCRPDGGRARWRCPGRVRRGPLRVAAPCWQLGNGTDEEAKHERISDRDLDHLRGCRRRARHLADRRVAGGAETVPGAPAGAAAPQYRPGRAARQRGRPKRGAAPRRARGARGSPRR
jgi:hypothetical protein